MRVFQIMDDFFHASDYLSLEYFMKKYDVSKRTIQNDISYLIQMSSRKGFQLHMRRGSGYLLEITNRELLQDFMISLQENTSFISKNRTQDILAYLAIQKNFITMDSIADALAISRTSVKNDMKDAVSLAQQYHLIIERKSHYGVRLEGSSIHYKTMLCELYFEENIFITNVMRDIEKHFMFVKDILVHKIEEEKLNINYNELRNVIVWIQVSIYYASMYEEDVQSILALGMEGDDGIYRIANVVSQAIETMYGIHMSEENMSQFIMILQKNVRLRQPAISFSGRLKKDVDQFLKEIDDIYDTTFQSDEDFRKLLLTHVSLLIDRLHQKISYKNTLVDELSIRYPMIFNIAIRFADMLNEKYGVDVTHDEVGFVATHFAAHMERESNDKIERYNRIGVVCSTGGGSAYLIKMQIQSLFPNADVSTYSFLQLKQLEQYQPDIIFTIMPLNREFSAPIIYIKELLDEVDLMRIRQILQYENYDLISIEDANDYIYKIFKRNFFQVVEEGSYQEIIHNMAIRIEEEGYGGEHYIDYVMERESYMCTVYLNGVAIPHPMQMCAKQNVISVTIPKHDVYVNGKKVSLIFMIALTKDDYEMHKDITKILYQLMKDEKRLLRILNVKTFEELMIVLKEVDGGNL